MEISVNKSTQKFTNTDNKAGSSKQENSMFWQNDHRRHSQPMLRSNISLQNKASLLTLKTVKSDGVLFLHTTINLEELVEDEVTQHGLSKHSFRRLSIAIQDQMLTHLQENLSPLTYNRTYSNTDSNSSTEDVVIHEHEENSNSDSEVQDDISKVADLLRKAGDEFEQQYTHDVIQTNNIKACLIGYLHCFIKACDKICGE